MNTRLALHYIQFSSENFIVHLKVTLKAEMFLFLGFASLHLAVGRAEAVCVVWKTSIVTLRVNRSISLRKKGGIQTQLCVNL